MYILNIEFQLVFIIRTNIFLAYLFSVHRYGKISQSVPHLYNTLSYSSNRDMLRHILRTISGNLFADQRRRMDSICRYRNRNASETLRTIPQNTKISAHLPMSIIAIRDRNLQMDRKITI